VQGLQFLVDLFVKDKSAATAKQLGASWDGVAFGKGTVAFSTGGPWYIGYMASSAPHVPYKLVPIPASTPGKTTMVTYGGGLSIFSDVSDKVSAMKLIEYLVRDQAMSLMVTGSLQYLPAKTRYMNQYVREVPQFAPLKTGFFHGRALDYPPKVNEFGAALTKGFEQLIFEPGQMSVQDLLNNLKEQFGT
jgi:multiple sugar transport system substrate-binding protein